MWPLFPSFSPRFPSLTHKRTCIITEKNDASPHFLINNNGVIKLSAASYSSILLQCNNYSALMSLLHCLHPALISAPLCDTQAASDIGFGQGWRDLSLRRAATRV